MRTDKIASSSVPILILLLLVPWRYVLRGPGQDGLDRVASTSLATVDSAQAGCFEEESYTENFETGWASNWYLGPGFQIVSARGGKSLVAGGASNALATYLLGDYWTDFSFGFAMKLISGEAWASLRYNSDGKEDLVYDRIRPTVTQRYLVKFASGSASLVRDDAGTFRVLGSATTSFDPNQWYTIGIFAVGGNLSLHVNNSPLISVTDTNPVPSGSIDLETRANTSVQFDDIQVVAQVPCEYTWTQTKTFPLGPDINVIAFNPSDSNVVYAGTEHAGVWRSADGGLTWTEVGYSGDMGRLGKSHGIAVAPTDARIVYAGFGGAEMDKSTDGGLHCTRTSLAVASATVQAVAVQPDNASVVYIARAEQAGPASSEGLFKSTDGGSSFQLILSSKVFAIAIPTSAPRVLYVGTTSGISNSTDGGASWTTVYTLSGTSTSGVSSLAVHPSDPNTVYAVAGGVIKSTDGGSSWRKVKDDGNLIFISASRPEALYLISGANISRSGDGGATWTTAKPLTTKPYILKTLAVDPSNPDKLFAGSWGQGIFFSKDEGATWSSPTTFAGPADLGVAVAVHPSDSKKVYVGTSKGEVYTTTDGGDNWTHLADLGTGSAYKSLITGLIIDPLNPDTLYASNLEGVYRSTDRGVTWKAIKTGLTDSRIISLTLDPKNPDRLYAGTGSSRPRNISEGTGMFYSVNGGDSWSLVPELPAAPIPSIVVNSLNTKVIYAAVIGFGIYKSVDAGTSWTQVNSGLENFCVYTLAMDPGNPDVVYAGTTNSSYCKSVVGKPDNVYKTSDGGKNWKVVRKGESIYENIESIAVDPSNPNNIYVTNHTEMIWFSGDAGSTWRLANQNVIRHGAHLYLWALAFDSSGSTLYLATCGRGLLKNSVNTPEAPRTFSFPNLGGASSTTSGTWASVSVGHARVQPASGSTTPSGVAIFGFRQNNVLVSETGVPASAALSSGRIYAEIGGAVDTGLAIANPNNSTATINFFFTNTAGNDIGSGSTTIPANGQLAKFLDQAPYNQAAPFQGTFSFTSNIPVSVVALRGFTNERGEFLTSTLPVIDTMATAAGVTQVIPVYADGGGWTTQILLVNPANTALTGNVQFTNPEGTAANVTIGGQIDSSFAYSVPPRSSQKLATTGASASTVTGSVRVVPTGGAAPTALVVFSYRPGVITVSEAGVPVTSGTALRMYVESSGQPNNIRSGIAVANTSSSTATVTFELTQLDGSSITGLRPASISLPGSGQTSKFLAETFPTLPNPFKGVLRITTTSSGISVVGLRSRSNERSEFLIATTPPMVENSPATTAERVFPHFADGGGYTTQFILFSGTAGQTSSGTLRFYGPDGQSLNPTLH